MHTNEEQFYVFLRFADGDISQALMALDHLPEIEAHFLRVCLLKEAAISYCRPFKKSNGTFPGVLKLDNNFIPCGHKDLHKELIDLRDKVFAHTDIDIRLPILHCWTHNPKPVFMITFKGYDYPHLLNRSDEMKSLFNGVLKLIRDKQAELEAQFLNCI